MSFFHVPPVHLFSPWTVGSVAVPGASQSMQQGPRGHVLKWSRQVDCPPEPVWWQTSMNVQFLVPGAMFLLLLLSTGKSIIISLACYHCFIVKIAADSARD